MIERPEWRQAGIDETMTLMQEDRAYDARRARDTP